jgi:CRP-like cAMP-binding protein
MLVLRLVATNGDGLWLAGLLIALALAAAFTNFVFTGKTWCNFICPVGLVERIYTEPGSLVRSASNSQCARCTACKKYCPDIDYWRELSSKGRRLATFAFPGLVLAFYTYFWLRHGDWEAYFDGRWTRLPADSELLLGPGFFFLEVVPAVAAATLVLLAFSAASYGVFLLCEAALGRFVADAERRRHVVLALAAFTAFTIFYVFAGAPTLRQLPGGTRTAAFVSPLVATLFVAKRWRRRREHYIREKGAAKLLRNWPFDDPPPNDPEEVYAWIKASDHARDKHLAAYSNTVREIIADGLVQGGELRLLEEVRKQLGISVREHEQVIARLSEEERELFTQEGSGGVELRAQLKGYQTALTEALLRHAPERELVELRQAFGISQEAHDSILDRMRSESGPLLERARGQIEQALTIHRDIATLGGDGLDAKSFLVHLLRRAQDSAIYRAAELLTVVGDDDRVEILRTRFINDDRETRTAAVRLLVRKCAGQGDLVRDLEALLVEPAPASAVPDVDAVTELLGRHASAADPYLRAACLWTAAKEIGMAAGPMLSHALEDPNELVRDTAVRGARHILELAEAELATQEGDASGPPGKRAEIRRVDREAPHIIADLWKAIGPESEASFSSLSMIERMQFLRCVPLFSGVDPEDLHELSLIAEEETIAPPRALCEEGDVESDDLFVLIESRASVVVSGKVDSDETEHEVAVLEPGAVVGELSLLDGGPRSATVRPKDDSLRVLRISSQRFRARLLHRQRVTNPLLANMVGVIRRLLARTAGAQDRS